MNEHWEAEIWAQLDSEGSRSTVPDGFPALPPIPSGRYHDPDLAALEDRLIWRRTWLLAGHVSQLPDAGSYRAVELLGIPLLLSRGDDFVVRCFYNSCRHRGAPVTRNESGTTARLTCQYHGWAYDSQGQLCHVPQERDFPGLDRSCRALIELRSGIVGGLVFVSMDDDPPDLERWLGSLPQQMAALGGSSLQVVGVQSEPIPCNWKLVVHAFLEFYHGATIHPESVPHLDSERIAISLYPHGHGRLVIDRRREGDRVSLPADPSDSSTVPAIFRDTFISFTMFPNLVMACGPGAFPIISAWPTGPETSRLELMWFGAPWGPGPAPVAYRQRMDTFYGVILQDLANLGSMQASLRTPGAPDVQLGFQERLIYQFEREVDRLLGDSVPADYRIDPLLDGWVLEPD